MTSLVYHYSPLSHKYNQAGPLNFNKCWKEDEFKEALKRDIVAKNNPNSILNLPAEIISDYLFPYLTNDYQSLVYTFASTTKQFLEDRNSRLYKLYYDTITIKCLMCEFKRVYPIGTPFVIACERVDLEVIRLFVTNHNSKIVGCSLNKMINNVGIDSFGRKRSPLMAAAANEHVNILQYLLELGADTSVVQNEEARHNVMHFAIRDNFKNLDTIKLLLKYMKASDITIQSHERLPYSMGTLALDMAYIYIDRNPKFKCAIINLFNQKGISCGISRCFEYNSEEGRYKTCGNGLRIVNYIKKYLKKHFI